MYDCHCIRESLIFPANDLVDCMWHYCQVNQSYVPILKVAESHFLALVVHTRNCDSIKKGGRKTRKEQFHDRLELNRRLPQITNYWNVFWRLIMIAILKHSIIIAGMPC